MIMQDDDKDPTGGGNGPFAGQGYGAKFKKDGWKILLYAVGVIIIVSVLKSL